MGALAIVLAGGSGTRMGSDRNKVFLPLGGRPLISWPLVTLEHSAAIAHLVLVHRDSDTAEITSILAGLGLTKLRATVVGGATRTGSELAGLNVARALLKESAMATSDLVFIHDGARPFVTHDLVDRLATAADTHGGAIPGFAPTEPVAELGPDGRLTALDVIGLRRVQTPQVFRAGALLAAYDESVAADFDAVDTAQVLERFGPANFRIEVVDADPRNIKLTVAEDLATGERIATQWSTAGWVTPSGAKSRPARRLRRAVARPEMADRVRRSAFPRRGSGEG